MRTPLKFLALLLAFSVMGLGTSSAGEKVWVGLYLAQNEPAPPGAKMAPEWLHDRLVDVFGFRHYELKKDEEFFLRNEWAQWFTPRRDFFLRLEPLHRPPGDPKMLEYQIYKDGFIVAKGTYELHEETPLFINGPDFRHGRLILVLEAR